MSVFHPMRALEAFRTFLGQRGLQEATLSVPEGFAAMLDFYRDVRAAGCTFEAADMLLFQWGTYSPPLRPGGPAGEAFDLDITRQLIVNEESEDDDFWQLSLSFAAEPTDELRALGNGDRWCPSLQELAPFRDYVLASAPFAAGTRLHIRGATLDYFCAG